MTIRDRYQIIENLVPLLNDEDWKNIVYYVYENCSSRIIRVIVDYLAKNKKDELAAAWPCGMDILKDCINREHVEGCNGNRALCQEEVDALIRGLSGGEF